METKLTKLSIDDVKQLQVLENKTFGKFAWPHSALSSYLLLRPGISYGLWEQGKLIGYVLATIDAKQICQLQTIVIAKSYRGMGYAKQLHLKVNEEARSLNCKHIITRIDVSNFPLYETLMANGYEEVEHIKNYYEDGQTALVMQYSPNL